MFSIRFAEGQGINFDDMKAADTWRFAPFFHELLQGGVDKAGEAVCVSSQTWVKLFVCQLEGLHGLSRTGWPGVPGGHAFR